MTGATLKHNVERLVQHAPSHEAMARGVLENLSRFFGTPMCVWSSLDPLTLLPTASFLLETLLQPGYGPPLHKLYYARDCDREARMNVASVARCKGGIDTSTRGLERSPFHNPTPALSTTGCSLTETCSPTAPWKNHGAYVSCVAQSTSVLLAH